MGVVDEASFDSNRCENGVAYLFDWRLKKRANDGPADQEPQRGFFGPHVILEDLSKRVPQYLDDVRMRTATLVPSGIIRGWRRCGT